MSDTDERAGTTGPEEAALPADHGGAPGPGDAPRPGSRPEPRPDRATGPEQATGPRPSPATEPGAVPGPAPAPDDIAAPDAPAPAPAPEHHPVPTARTRFGGLWVVLISGTVVLVLLLVFILQNSQRVEVHIYGGHWNAPLGVALLMAAALGVLLVVIPGTGRIIQLRRAALRAHRRADRLAQRQPAAHDERSADRPQA